MSEAKHCPMCGTTHSGNCPPSAFVFFECSNCGLAQQLPWDVMSFGGGLNGMYCGCGKEAEKAWKDIEHEKYLEIESQQNQPDRAN